MFIKDIDKILRIVRYGSVSIIMFLMFLIYGFIINFNQIKKIEIINSDLNIFTY